MINKGFLDEIVLRYKTEQRHLSEKQEALKEKNDITRGYAYINDEKITFSHFQLLNTGLSVLIPDVFIKDRPPVIAEQTVELSNYDKSVYFFFEIPQNSAKESIAFSYTENEEESRYRLDFENARIKGSFTCADYRVKDWKELLFQIMYSVIGLQK